jgi:hypothetical protein
MTEPREQPSDDETALAEVPEATLAEFIQQPAKLIRIASMIRGLLDEVRQAPLDESGRKRLRSVHESSLRELKAVLSEDLQRELSTLALPLEGTPSDAEIRVAQAQLLGWLEGLFHGIQAALFAQHMQARAQFEEMRRRGLPGALPGRAAERPGEPPARPGQYL